ncbi:MAG: type IV secretion system DNA-binding domain-containing protein [Cyanobacteria bacterium P01_E01_bin.6]
MIKGATQFTIVAGFTAATHQLIYTTTTALTDSLITAVRLETLNSNNWIGQFIGIASIAGTTWVLFRITGAGFGRRRKRVLKTLLTDWSQQIAKSLVIGLGSYALCHIVGMTNPTEFLLSLILGVGTSPAVVSSGGVGGLIRGFRLRDPRWIAQQWFWRYTKDLIPWGAGFVKPKLESTHFALIGNTGSGKSTFLSVMMSRLRGLRGVGIVPDMRAVVLDAKRELIPFLVALGVHFRIWNPLDIRCVAWFIGRDIQGEGKASEFANALYSDDADQGKSQNPYFPNTAKILIRNVVTALWLACGDQWTLRHLILVCSTISNVQKLLQKHHPRPNEVDELLKSRNQGPNEVLTTVQSKLLPLSMVAARWDEATEKYSLKEWLQREEVMVLGSDHTYPDTLKLTNTLILKFLVAELNTLSASNQRRIWLYIDEASAAGRFIHLENVVSLGRSAGVCVVIAFQNIDLFLRTYGEHLAKSILGLCRHWAIFGLDMISAQWVSSLIGEYEEVQTSVSESHSTQVGPSGSSTTTGVSYQSQVGRRPTVLPQQMMDLNLPQTGPDSGVLAGFFLSPGEGIHFHQYAWEHIRRWQVDPVDETECPAYLRIDDAALSLSLKPLTVEEQHLFGLEP